MAMNDESDVAHGALTYPPFWTIPARTVETALDDETMALVTGPGMDAADLWEFHPHLAFGQPVHAIVEDGRFVGVMSFNPPEKAGSMPGSTVVGFWLRRSARRRGILTSAWRHLSPMYGTRFSAGCWTRNEPVRGLLDQLGFRLVGRLQHTEGESLEYEMDARPCPACEAIEGEKA